jgi:hypothetical protein
MDKLTRVSRRASLEKPPAIDETRRGQPKTEVSFESSMDAQSVDTDSHPADGDSPSRQISSDRKHESDPSRTIFGGAFSDSDVSASPVMAPLSSKSPAKVADAGWRGVAGNGAIGNGSPFQQPVAGTSASPNYLRSGEHISERRKEKFNLRAHTYILKAISAAEKEPLKGKEERIRELLTHVATYLFQGFFSSLFFFFFSPLFFFFNSHLFFLLSRPLEDNVREHIYGPIHDEAKLKTNRRYYELLSE